MEPISWEPSFSVGVGTLDAQHQQIIEMINRLLSAPDVYVGSEAISEMLARMVTYADAHFVAEERLLEARGYAELSAHRRQHRFYRRTVIALCQDTIESKTAVPVDLLEFLRSWWTNHILNVDARYRSLFGDEKVASPGRARREGTPHA